jgi:hypothetical protein
MCLSLGSRNARIFLLWKREQERVHVTFRSLSNSREETPQGFGWAPSMSEFDSRCCWQWPRKDTANWLKSRDPQVQAQIKPFDSLVRGIGTCAQQGGSYQHSFVMVGSPSGTPWYWKLPWSSNCDLPPTEARGSVPWRAGRGRQGQWLLH